MLFANDSYCWLNDEYLDKLIIKPNRSDHVDMLTENCCFD